MNYLFDTNIVAFLYDVSATNHWTIYKKFSNLQTEDSLFISVLTLYELEYSLANANESQKLLLRQLIDKTETQFQILLLNPQGGRIYGELKSSLKRGKNISRENIKKHNIDIMLASTAISWGCILVSDDNIFETISELNTKFQFQNWLG